MKRNDDVAVRAKKKRFYFNKANESYKEKSENAKKIVYRIKNGFTRIKNLSLQFKQLRLITVHSLAVKIFLSN